MKYIYSTGWTSAVWSQEPPAHPRAGIEQANLVS